MEQNADSLGPLVRHRLESWKEIAVYLKRDIRTVQRWEKHEDLPVHRHLHARASTVYAFPRELDAWTQKRQLLASTAETGPRAIRSLAVLLSRKWIWLALGAAVAATGIAAWKLSPPAEAPSLGTRRVWLTPDVDHLGSVSQDGKLLCFRDGETADLAVMQSGGNKVRRLTQKPPQARIGGAFWPVFSRQARWITYSWELADVVDLRVIGIDGSGERVLARHPDLFRISALDVSPDDQWILAWSQARDGSKRLLLVDSTTGALRTVAELGFHGPLHAGFSPDGGFIAYDLPDDRNSGERDVFVQRLEDGTQSALVQHSGQDWFWGWAPNGQVLFGCDRTGTVDAWTVAVANGKPAGEPKLVQRNVGPIRPMNFTRNGSFYFGLRSRLTDVLIAEVDPTTGMPSGKRVSATDQHVGENHSPDWSSDGKWLAYVRHPPQYAAENRHLISIRPSAGGPGRELMADVPVIEMMRWTRDGHGFLVAGRDVHERSGVFRIDASTGAASTIVLDQSPQGTYHEPLNTADGRRIFYKRRQGSAEPAPLFVLDVASGRETEFLPSVYRLSLSPDGNTLAYCTFDEQHERITTIPVSGGKPVELAELPREGRLVSLAWSHDGRWVFFARRGLLWRVPAQGGAPEKTGFEEEAMRELRMHPDGKRIAFTAGSSARGEVWVMENLLGTLRPFDR